MRTIAVYPRGRPMPVKQKSVLGIPILSISWLALSTIAMYML
jgi:hypothetical protein